MVVDAPAGSGNESKSFWTKIGVAVENDDGSLTLTLAAIPVTGKMMMTEPQTARLVADLSARSRAG